MDELLASRTKILLSENICQDSHNVVLIDFNYSNYLVATQAC